MVEVRGMDDNRLEIAANMLRAIAHPMRIAILKYLEGGKKLTVSEIHELLNIEQSTTSHHLGILRDKGVLCSKREGKNTYYYLKHEILSQIIDCLEACTCSPLPALRLPSKWSFTISKLTFFGLRKPCQRTFYPRLFT